MNDIVAIVKECVTSILRSAVDKTLKENVDFQSKCGRNPKIKRTLAAGCCEWCAGLAGTYSYPAPDDVYKRHNNCNCLVEYAPGTGSVQNVHTKEWTEVTDSDILEMRKTVGLTEIRRKDPFQRAHFRTGSMTTQEYAELQRRLSYAREYEQLYLLPDEYARVMSEIRTHLSDADRECPVVTKAIGNNYILSVMMGMVDT